MGWFPYLFDTIPLWMAERQILDFSEYQLWPFENFFWNNKKREWIVTRKLKIQRNEQKIEWRIKIRKGGVLKVMKRNKIRKCLKKFNEIKDKNVWSRVENR